MMPANEAIFILAEEEWVQYEEVRVQLVDYYLDKSRSYNRRMRIRWFIMGFHEEKFEQFGDLPPRPEYPPGFVHVVHE